MSTRQEITNSLDTLSQSDVELVAQYVAFLRYQARINAFPVVDESQLAALYAEFADEDRELAEAGLADYESLLVGEDEQ